MLRAELHDVVDAAFKGEGFKNLTAMKLEDVKEIYEWLQTEEDNLSAEEESIQTQDPNAQNAQLQKKLQDTRSQRIYLLYRLGELRMHIQRSQGREPVTDIHAAAAEALDLMVKAEAEKAAITQQSNELDIIVSGIKALRDRLLTLMLRKPPDAKA